MYESMKPKDAAKVFDRLDMAVLIEIASQIAPRKMSRHPGPDAAGGRRAADGRTGPPRRRRQGEAAAELPKIEGKMLSQKPN